MIDGSTTRLREPREADLAVLGRLRNDLSLQRRLLARGRPNGEDRVREWVQRVSNAADSAFFVVADLQDDPLGFVQLTAMDLVDGHAHLGIALVEEGRGRGHGAEAVQLVASYGRSVFGLRKVVLEVASTNGSAIALYEQLGFRQVGVLEAHVRADDGHLDVVIMELLLDR
ncbi:N/A [soil metagenome]